MQLKRAIVGFCVAITAPSPGLILGCGDDKGSTASASDSASDSAGSSGGTDPVTATGPTDGSGSMSATEGDDAGSMSMSMSGTTEISGGMSASMSGSEDSGDETTGDPSTSTGMVSGGGDTSASSTSTSTGEPIDCAEFGNQVDCVAADCMAIMARPFIDDGATWCLDSSSFLACEPQVGCDDVITTACKGATKYQFSNGCLPAGFAICAAPPDAGMDGYADCP